jgi:hypothetical protein
MMEKSQIKCIIIVRTLENGSSYRNSIRNAYLLLSNTDYFQSKSGSFSCAIHIVRSKVFFLYLVQILSVNSNSHSVHDRMTMDRKGKVAARRELMNGTGNGV